MLAPSRVTSHSKTLIDNIFRNSIADEALSGNITTTLLDHYAQFVLTENIKNKKEFSSKYMRDFRRLK